MTTYIMYADIAIGMTGSSILGSAEPLQGVLASNKADSDENVTKLKV